MSVSVCMSVCMYVPCEEDLSFHWRGLLHITWSVTLRKLCFIKLYLVNYPCKIVSGVECHMDKIPLPIWQAKSTRCQAGMFNSDTISASLQHEWWHSRKMLSFLLVKFIVTPRLLQLLWKHCSFFLLNTTEIKKDKNNKNYLLWYILAFGLLWSCFHWFGH